MTRRSVWAAVAAAVLTATIVAGFALAGAGKHQASKDRGTTTLVLINKETDDFAFNDVGEPGEGPGDSFIHRNDLFDAKGSKKVGDAFLHCVLQFGEPLRSQCDVVARLDGRGDVVLSGLAPAAGPDPFDLAVTGGTGGFRFARGQAHLEVIDEGPPLTQRVTVELRGVR
jgi:hypothetical protein